MHDEFSLPTIGLSETTTLSATCGYSRLIAAFHQFCCFCYIGYEEEMVRELKQTHKRQLPLKVQPRKIKCFESNIKHRLYEYLNQPAHTINDCSGLFTPSHYY